MQKLRKYFLNRPIHVYTSIWHERIFAAVTPMSVRWYSAGIASPHAALRRGIASCWFAVDAVHGFADAFPGRRSDSTPTGIHPGHGQYDAYPDAKDHEPARLDKAATRYGPAGMADAIVEGRRSPTKPGASSVGKGASAIAI